MKNSLKKKRKGRHSDPVRVQDVEDEAPAKPAKSKKKTVRRKRPQIGDGSVLQGIQPKNAAESVQQMMKVRGGDRFSKYLNYDKLQNLFPGKAASPAGSEAAGPSSSATPTVATPGNQTQATAPLPQPQPQPQPALVPDDDEVDYEGEEEEEMQEEEEYDEEDDQGFGDEDLADDF